MAKNHLEKANTIKKMFEDEVASAAVLRVVGEDIDSTYPDVDDHPGSLDLPVRTSHPGCPEKEKGRNK